MTPEILEQQGELLGLHPDEKTPVYFLDGKMFTIEQGASRRKIVPYLKSPFDLLIGKHEIRIRTCVLDCRDLQERVS